MQTQLEILRQLSKRYGTDKDYIIASGGNSSYKTADYLWITASGSFLGKLQDTDLLKLSRKKLAKLRSKNYGSDARKREEDVKNDLVSSMTDTGTNKRPSVETSIHDLIEYAYVIHTHPTRVNGLLCSNQAESMTKKLFGEMALYVAYQDPGYTLFKKVEQGVLAFRRERKRDPKLIFIQNHGIFVGSDSPEEIIRLYAMVDETISKEITIYPDVSQRSIDKQILAIMPEVRNMVSKERLMFMKVRNHALIESYLENESLFEKISRPFTPDIIVFCKSRYLYVNVEKNSEKILNALEKGLKKFQSDYGYLPKILLVKHLGMISVSDNEKYSEIILDIFEDLIKISCYSENFGGPHFMNDREVTFIEEWEAEKYRYEMARKT